MKLAKPCLDVALITCNLEPMLAFWNAVPGIAFDHVLPIGPGRNQHRFTLAGSVIKINHYSSPPPENPPSGLTELLVATGDVDAVRELRDPDGNHVTLVPPGSEGVTQIAMRLSARDLAAHRDFYGRILGLPEPAPGQFEAGRSRLLISEDPLAPCDAQVAGTGWRYLTLQVFDAAAEHDRIVGLGGREGEPVRTFGDVARFSMVRDPDGNWIEISQRASLVGRLD